MTPEEMALVLEAAQALVDPPGVSVIKLFCSSLLKKYVTLFLTLHFLLNIR